MHRVFKSAIHVIIATLEFSKYMIIIVHVLMGNDECDSTHFETLFEQYR